MLMSSHWNSCYMETWLQYTGVIMCLFLTLSHDYRIICLAFLRQREAYTVCSLSWWATDGQLHKHCWSQANTHRWTTLEIPCIRGAGEHRYKALQKSFLPPLSFCILAFNLQESEFFFLSNLLISERGCSPGYLSRVWTMSLKYVPISLTLFKEKTWYLHLIPEKEPRCWDTPGQKCQGILYNSAHQANDALAHHSDGTLQRWAHEEVGQLFYVLACKKKCQTESLVIMWSQD